MNSNNNKNWTDPKIVLDHFNKLYDILTKKNNKKSINTEQLMILYDGFYSTYIFLLKKKLITQELSAKRKEIDRLYNQNMPSIKKSSNYKYGFASNLQSLKLNPKK
jgi:hypothetical protein